MPIQLIVTRLRIVEREERYDAEALHQEKSAGGFLAPGRPKRWKDKVMSVLARKVKEMVEGNQLDDRDSDKMWLVRHLECIRIFTLDGLRVVKTLCQPVFPPKYEIMDHYIKLYNDAIKVRVRAIVFKCGIIGLFLDTFRVVFKTLLLASTMSQSQDDHIYGYSQFF